MVLGITLIAAMIILGTVAVGFASTEPLEGGDSIVLENVDGVTRFVYGDYTQTVKLDGNSCTVLVDPLNPGEIMELDAATYDKNGDPIDAPYIGLVEDGIGVNASGNGNAQHCGRVDALDDELSEELTLTLGTLVLEDEKFISSIDFDFEAKFDAVVSVEFFSPSGNFTEIYITELTGNGSDSGPDAKNGDKYRVIGAPKMPANQGKLITGIEISMDTGSVSLEGGATWPDPSANRTVFHLTEFLSCGESTTTGGEYLTDDPRAALYLGPDKHGLDCEIAVDISTQVGSGEQTVSVGPPSGFNWNGVTGVVTVEWDRESIDDANPVARTVQRTSSGDIIVPWCKQDVDIEQSSNNWFYSLTLEFPDNRYDEATDGGAACLIMQETRTVVDDGDIFTQTTEVFYLWDDPIFARPR
jgi:hypothetical protein